MSLDKNIPELLAPAGNFEKLCIAVHYGADAVYLGATGYSLRAHATFSPQAMREAVRYAHDHGVNVYVTINIFAHNRDFDRLPHYLEELAAINVDGLIVADPGVLSLARQTVPQLPIHLSTQANVCNSASALFWQQQGVRRLNLARELSLVEITEIRRQTGCEIEVFVHGALCISYSGRCMLSYYLTGRDANRGDCAHPCRYGYAVQEEQRPGQYFPVEEDARGTYIFNSRDLCLMNRLPELVKAGVHCLKIEGRMKSPYYVGATVRAYRAALDFLKKESRQNGEMPAEWPAVFMEELRKVGSRGYTENFLDSPPNTKDMLHDRPRVAPSHQPVGIVRQAGSRPLVEVRNPLCIGDEIEYLGRDLKGRLCRIAGMTDADGLSLQRANPGNTVTLLTEPAPRQWLVHALLRRRCEGNENKKVAVSE